MKAIFWNARGVVNDRFYKKLCVEHKPDVLLIAESWTTSSLSGFWKSLHMRLFYVNDRQNLQTNLWAICYEELSFTSLACSSQYISFSSLVEGQ